MRERERKIVRRRLDVEMRPYRRAAMETDPTDGLLSVVRQVLRIPVLEVAGKVGVERSVLYGLETSERRRTITLKSLNRVAKAMGCRVVYGVVPEGGLTFEELADEIEEMRRASKSASERVSKSASQRVGESAS